MYFLEILIALPITQIWGPDNRLHNDQWFRRWVAWLERWRLLRKSRILHLIKTLAVPAFVLALLLYWLPNWAELILGTAVLLYSFGRGEFAVYMEPYLATCREGEWHNALDSARRVGVDVADVAPDDWSHLHEKALEATAYQGFERLFAVLFWFAAFGPIGALVYRLSFLYSRQYPAEVSQRWLWALEWLPVRLLSLTFAITGNFVGCIHQGKQSLRDINAPTGQVLLKAVQGALSVGDERIQSCDVTQREVAAIRQLYIRTLWCWLALMAILSILL